MNAEPGTSGSTKEGRGRLTRAEKGNRGTIP
jgi:hypothetical protein